MMALLSSHSKGSFDRLVGASRLAWSRIQGALLLENKTLSMQGDGSDVHVFQLFQSPVSILAVDNDDIYMWSDVDYEGAGLPIQHLGLGDSDKVTVVHSCKNGVYVGTLLGRLFHVVCLQTDMSVEVKQVGTYSKNIQGILLEDGVLSMVVLEGGLCIGNKQERRLEGTFIGQSSDSCVLLETPESVVVFDVLQWRVVLDTQSKQVPDFYSGDFFVFGNVLMVKEGESKARRWIVVNMGVVWW